MKDLKKNIVVVGIGYVGLSIATFLAQNNNVIAVDIIQQRVNMINERKNPFYDKEIEKAFENKKLMLSATMDTKSAYMIADYVIIATPTNYDSRLNFFDTSAVKSVIEEVLSVNAAAIIVIKSTVPVGFTRDMRKKTNRSNIYFSPEFLREGQALQDHLYPSRIIVGADLNDEEQLQTANDIVNLFKQGAKKDKISSLIIGLTESEAVKLFANTYLALRVSYFNELDTYAEVKMLNTRDIIEGVCLDPRIGEYYNNPSFGYGGYCLPKDTRQLLASYEDIPENLIRATIQSNITRKNFVANQIIREVKLITNDLSNAVVGIFRLVMKMDSDNFRQSSIIDIMNQIRYKGIKIVVYEPSLNMQNFLGFRVIKNIVEFKQISDLVVANRYSSEIEDIKQKVYTRDLYHRD